MIAALLLLASIAAPACKRARRPPRRRRARGWVRSPSAISTPPEAAPARLDTDAIERAVRGRLLATGQFETDAARADAGAGGVTRALVQLGIDSAEVGDKGLARARVACA